MIEDASCAAKTICKRRNLPRPLQVSQTPPTLSSIYTGKLQCLQESFNRVIVLIIIMIAVSEVYSCTELHTLRSLLLVLFCAAVCKRHLCFCCGLNRQDLLAFGEDLQVISLSLRSCTLTLTFLSHHRVQETRAPSRHILNY